MCNFTIAQESSNNFYDSVHLGERKIPMFYGTTDPLYKFSNILGNISFEETHYYEQYLPSFISKDIFSLYKLWEEEIPVKSNCPDYYLNENIEYIRYLYRLLTISYIFEGLKEYHIQLYEIGENEKAASLDWNKVIGKCTPKTIEMRKFVKRVKSRYMENWNPGSFSKLNKSELSKWLERFKTLRPRGIAKIRAYKWLLENGYDISDVSIEDIGKALISSYNSDLNSLNTFCSEKDDLYGMSYINNAADLIIQSNASNVINDGGHGLSCLNRYSKLFKSKEMIYADLDVIFSLVSKQLIAKDSRYVQGELFLPGALKEFDDKGLGDFLFVEKKVEPKPVPKPVIIAKIEPKPVPKPKVIPKVVEKKKVVVVPKVEPKPVVKVSAFETARNILENTDVNKVSINMNKMKEDLVFSQAMIKALEAPIKDYQTREALDDMKKYDGLGTKTEPMRLIFLKFLIENNMHQGLYNITSIIGEKFWVLNDLEGKTTPVYAEILNDESTKYKWQLNLLDHNKK
ncbi:hypothetical protein [Halobacteriovorax sp. HLS]|uniref:hypothetical protein n=1 Tax=Halobacteriovorax sp. HLS TaxID=2234000 RepID=UPI000FDB5D25|nr:hypothetical protein [Halobacteriovorax sp. HLS]